MNLPPVRPIYTFCSCDLWDVEAVEMDALYTSSDSKHLKSGYTTKINYQDQNNQDINVNEKKRKRTRNIIWFNPPFSANVKTKIGRKFLNLINKHFPKENKLHKIFNKNSIKVSYSCMKNMNSIIKSHNRRILKKFINQEIEEENKCNCRNKSTCPLQGKCLESELVYKASISTASTSHKSQEQKVYIGLTGGRFKERYRNHLKSFKSEKYKNETELSKEVWKMKKKNESYQINWQILKKSNTKIRNDRRCDLCIEESYQILIHNSNSLNKNKEILSSCKHNELKKNRSRINETDR